MPIVRLAPDYKPPIRWSLAHDQAQDPDRAEDEAGTECQDAAGERARVIVDSDRDYAIYLAGRIAGEREVLAGKTSSGPDNAAGPSASSRDPAGLDAGDKLKELASLLDKLASQLAKPDKIATLLETRDKIGTLLDKLDLDKFASLAKLDETAGPDSGTSHVEKDAATAAKVEEASEHVAEVDVTAAAMTPTVDKVAGVEVI